MNNHRHPNVTLTVKVWFKLLYYEMPSLILLSIAFWVVSIPVVTIGAAILAMFDIIRAIYAGDVPRGERKRLKQFFGSVRIHLFNGLVFSLFLVFLIVNTGWYFFISLSGANVSFIIGGLIGLYAVLLLMLFTFRMINIHSVSDVDWRTSIRSTVSMWGSQPTLTVLQLTIVTIAMLFTVLVPPALVLLAPAAIILFELVYYDELTGHNPQKSLTRYKRENDF